MNTESMNTELLWQRMQEDWQAAQPIVDASALVRQINRRHRFMSTCLTVEIVLTVALTCGLAVLMFADPAAIAPMAILIALGWVTVFAHIWIRRGSWRTQSTDTRALLRLVERRARGGIRYAWLQIIGGFVALPVAGAWQWHTSHAQAVPVWILLGTAAVGGTIWWLRYRRRQLRKLQHTRALLEQLSREDGNP